MKYREERHQISTGQSQGAIPRHVQECGRETVRDDLIEQEGEDTTEDEAQWLSMKGVLGSGERERE